MYSNLVQCRLGKDWLLRGRFPVLRGDGASRGLVRGAMTGSARWHLDSTNDFGHAPIQPDPSPNPLPGVPCCKRQREGYGCSHSPRIEVAMKKKVVAKAEALEMDWGDD